MEESNNIKIYSIICFDDIIKYLSNANDNESNLLKLKEYHENFGIKNITTI